MWPRDPDLMLKAVVRHSKIYLAYPLTITQTLLGVDDLIKHQPSEERGRDWLHQTKSSFNPFDTPTDDSPHTIECPHCFKKIRVRRCSFSLPCYVQPADVSSTAYLTSDGKGYLQAEFTAECPSSSCTDVITKERLAVLKFARDAVLDPNDKTDFRKHSLACYQACVSSSCNHTLY